MFRIAIGTIVLLGLAFHLSFAQGTPERVIPPEVEAVRAYILNEDYPEVFNGKKYRMKIHGWEVVDIDGDGIVEVFLWTQPHYRQSPSILIYQVDKSGKVRRLAEGLAPGRLVPIGGEYLDGHTVKDENGKVSTVDLSFDLEKNGIGSLKNGWGRTIAVESLGQHLRVVVYRNFVHMDGAAGSGTVVDMTHLPAYGKAQSCVDFEFSKVYGTVSGTIKGQGSRKFLAAATSGEIYVYRIDGIDSDGLLKKQLWVIKPEPAGRRFGIDGAGNIGYDSADGKFHPIELPK